MCAHADMCVCVCVGKIGLFRELNPGPPAPEAGIIPLDQTAKCFAYTLLRGCFWFGVVVLGGWRGRCLAVVARCLLSLGSIPTGGCVALMFCTCGGFWFFGFAVGRCCNSPHWGLNPGPSVYKTDALPLSYRGTGPGTASGTTANKAKPNTQNASCGVRGSNPRAVACSGS